MKLKNIFHDRMTPCLFQEKELRNPEQYMEAHFFEKR